MKNASEHHSQDERQSIAEAIAQAFGEEEPTEALRRRLAREEASRQYSLGEQKKAA